MRIMAKPVWQATPSIVTIITEFNVPTPGALFWLNSSQMPPHVPGRGVVGHYFDRCIIHIGGGSPVCTIYNMQVDNTVAISIHKSLSQY